MYFISFFTLSYLEIFDNFFTIYAKKNHYCTKINQKIIIIDINFKYYVHMIY